MALQEFYVGEVGPLYYDDTLTYPDSELMMAFRAKQLYIEDDPTEDYHVVRSTNLPATFLSGAEQGDILYFNGASWVALNHGTAGQVLQTGGHGANPSWADVETGSGDWTEDTDTWVYVSASSFKIEGKDVTSRFPVGCKLKWTQTTDKYAYVRSVAFSTNTTVTIVVSDDYTVANATITSPQYSYASSPTGFPQWFNWTETWTGFSSSPSGGASRYRIDGKTITWMLGRSTNGTSNNAATAVTAPVTAKNVSNYYQYGFGLACDNGTWADAAARWYASPNSTTINLCRSPMTTTWTASGAKNWVGTIMFEME